MKELLTSFAAYNSWAHKMVQDMIVKLPAEKLHQELPSSFKTLHATLLHMYEAEQVWWQRLLLAENIVLQNDHLKNDTRLLCDQMIIHAQKFHRWIDGKTEMYFTHTVQYQNSRREYFKQPVYEILLHVFNHNTYHRGQVINMLRQLGTSKFLPIDYIEWSRKK